MHAPAPQQRRPHADEQRERTSPEDGDDRRSWNAHRLRGPNPERKETGVMTAASPVSGGPCRFCGTELRHTFVDLGISPLCESFLDCSQLNSMEAFFPLHVFVCHRCFLVQL